MVRRSEKHETGALRFARYTRATPQPAFKRYGLSWHREMSRVLSDCLGNVHLDGMGSASGNSAPATTSRRVTLNRDP